MGRSKERAFEQKEKVHKHFPLSRWSHRTSGTGILPSHPCLLEQWGRPTGVCRVAGGTGSYCNQRKTGSSRWGTPCLTYRVWIFQGASGRAHLVFFVFRPLVRDFQTCYSYILSSHDGSLRRLSPHMPENQIQFARRTIHWTLTWMDFQMQIFWCLGKSTYQFAAPMLLGLAIAGDFPDPLDFCANAQIPIWFYVAMNFWQSYFHCSRWQHPLLILDIPLSNLLLCYGIVYICTS